MNIDPPKRILTTNMNTDNTKQPNKGLDIGSPTSSFDLHTEKLGILKVGRPTMKALIKISPDLDLKSEVSDQDLVKAVFFAVTTRPSKTDEEQPCSLTTDDEAQVTEQDIQNFAKCFLEAENWEAASNENPVTVLAKKIRSLIRQIGEPTKKMMDPFQGVLSNDTKRLFMMNTALSERLKEVSGLSTWNNPLKMNATADLMKDFSGLSTLSDKSTDLMKNFSEGVTMASSSSPESKVPKIKIPPSVDLPINRVAKAMTESNRKVDSLKETLDVMAAAIGVMNEAITSALLDFKAKQQIDDRNQKRNIGIAKVSLVASVILSGVSLWFSWASYEFQKSSDISSNEQRISAENEMAEQTKLLRDILLTQQEQKKLLVDSQISVTARRSNPKAQETPRNETSKSSEVKR